MADFLVDGVQKSQDTAADIKQRTVDILEEARLIHSRVIADNPAAQLEYEQVRLSAVGALADLKNETSAELEAVRGELGDGGKIDPFLYSEGSISEEELANIETQFQELEAIDANAAWTELPPELATIADKSFSEYSPEEAKQMLQFLQGDYRKYRDLGGSELIGGGTYNACGTQQQVNAGQEILIDIIYGTGTSKIGVSGENLVGSSSDEGGNYIINATEFEQRLKNGSDINRKVIASYINYVENKCGGDTERFRLWITKSLGQRTEKVNEFLQDAQDENIIAAKDKLVKIGVFKEEEGGFFDYFTQLYNGFLANFNGASSYFTEGNIDANGVKQNLAALSAFKDTPFDEETRGTLQTQANTIREGISADIKNPNSQASFQMADIPLGAVTNAPEAAELVLEAKVQEYDRDLETNLDTNPELRAGKEALMDMLSGLFVTEKNPEQIQELYDIIEAEIRKNPGEIESVVHLKTLLEGKGVSGDIIADLIKQVQIQEFERQRVKISMAWEEALGLEEKVKNGAPLSPEEAERLQVLKTYYSRLSLEANRLEIQLLIEGQDTEGTMAQYLRGEITEAAFSEWSSSQLQRPVIAAEVATQQTEIKAQEEVIEALGDGELKPEQIETVSTAVSEDLAAAEAVSSTARLSISEEVKSTNPDWKPSETTLATLQEDEQKVIEYVSGPHKPNALVDQSISRLETQLGPDHEFTRKIQEAKQSSERYNTTNESLGKEGGVIVNTENGPVIKTTGGLLIPITPQEQRVIKGNPDALQNMVDFYSFFQDLNLQSVWQYRTELVNTMGNININLEDDSINPTELVRFGNEFIKIVNGLLPAGEELHENHANIFSLKAELRRFSESGNFMSGNKSFNELGEDKFEDLMRKYGIIGGAVFLTEELRKATREEGKFSDEEIEKQN